MPGEMSEVTVAGDERDVVVQARLHDERAGEAGFQSPGV